MSVLVVVAALGEMACPVIVGNVSTYSLFVHSFIHIRLFSVVKTQPNMNRLSLLFLVGICVGMVFNSACHPSMVQ